MATGNLFLGHARGKVGSLVFSRQNGEQVTRALNTRPKNPQTDQQIVQRAIAGTVMYAYSYLQEICNHSFEGIAYGAKSQQYFTKVNMDLLRQLYAANPTNTNPMMFSKKNSKSAVANSYIIAKGSISNTPIQPKLVKEKDDVLYHLGEIKFPALVNEMTVSEYLDAIGLAKAKDQITLILIRPTFDVIGMGYDDSLKNQYKLNAMQIDRAIRTSYSPEDVAFATAEGSDNTKFYDELAKCLEFKKNSDAPGLEIIIDHVLNNKNGAKISVAGALAAGIIYSSFDNVKGWLRSNSQLVCSNSYLGTKDSGCGLSAGNLIDYWDDSASVVVSNRLLNNGNA